ncbi:Eukaryotic aspartyl protease family protein [Raphanus sativus]|uniref:Protein ASPARTIC PROTEASE IN GUARD CELL 2 n=1 Tax=Raphanus sativus TaxID=3726 RepID=A0A6J0KUT6_RAPSA|nr:protein ASPARTIC PROTEASE IN GUARD CELL 2 [Raphanus sativus]KAJ4910575.1 Eukaryotic aspartyl protease family protein [Raphanus sativus]
MALTLISATITLLIYLSLSINSNAALPSDDDGSRPPMLLPLFLSHQPNSTSRSVSIHHRKLQKSLPHSRMRLYDDLLLNGYYTTRLWIGTPPQMFALIVDSGSTVTYVPCSDCEQCGKHQDPKFQPEMSTTYQPVKCNMDCNCDDDKEQCLYEREYAEHSSSKGVLGEDLISFGNESQLTPQRAVFGCETVETGDLYSQRADGIIGLGQGDLSLVDQLVDKGLITNSFALCYGGMDIGGGSMVLGGFAYPPDMIFTDSDPDRSPYYNIDLTGIRVAGKQLSLSSGVFDGEHGAVLDSGTTYAYLPDAAFAAFEEAVMREASPLKQIDGPDPNFKDTCFHVAPSNDASGLSKIFPSVEMVFKSGQSWLLSPENYLFRHSKVHGAYCLGVFPNGKDHTTLLGGIVVRNTLVVYDRENSKVGFWRTNCSELSDRLPIDGAPPGPPQPPPAKLPLNDSNPSLNTSSNLPGEKIQIGQINLDIQLTVNSSYLKPRIEELFKVFSKELDIKTTQVYLSNLTSNGTNSLIRVVVFPPQSSSLFSNVTATSIVSRFSNHQIKLPDIFGDYQLVAYKLEPPREGTRWQMRNTIVVIAIVMVSVVVGLLAYGVWLMWKRKQGSNPYTPVDEATTIVAEQELQPL